MRGSVTKKRNRWYIYYYTGKDKTGKWQRKWEGSWETKREAERVLRSRIEELENTFDRKAEKSTVAVYLRHWLDTYCKQHLAANTVRGYQVNIENHIIPKIGNIPLDKLKPKDIQQLYTDLIEAGLSGTSVRYVHNNLHKALGQAAKEELIPRNPANFVEAPRVDRYEAQALTPEQAKTLLKSCQGEDIYLPVLLAVTLGLRRGEALGLQWCNVDLDAGTVTIRQSASFSPSGLCLSATKTRNSRRTLLLPDGLHTALQKALDEQQEKAAQLGAGYNPLGLVCCREDGSPMTSNALHHLYKEALERCGLPSIRFHDLRHTNATLMLRNAVPAKIVSAMLGHSSIGITMDTYSHVITEMQESATEVMDSLFDGSW